MLTLVLRRARAQRRLLASVVALVAAAATLAGVCALLLGPTQERAYSRALTDSEPHTVQADAYMLRIDSDDLSDVRTTAVERLSTAYAALDPVVTTRAFSEMRDLVPDDERAEVDALGYLATGDGIAASAELVDGSWPASAGAEPETTIPEAAAERLGLAVGDRVTLGDNRSGVGLPDPLTLRVVGVYRPRSALGWETDPLQGAGYDPEFPDRSTTIKAYGPFALDDTAFLGSGTPVSGLRVTATPRLAGADRDDVVATADGLDGANGLLASQVRDRVQISRVASELPVTLARIDAQQAAGRSTVLAAVLLGAVLALTAVALAGRLVAGVRDEERVLLVAIGTSPRQQLATAVLESALLAAVATLIALPAAVLLHHWLTHLAAPTAAGLAQAPGVTLGLVLAVVGGALVLTPALVATTLDTGTSSVATRRRWALARSGADLTLAALALAVAAYAWRQLADQPGTTAARGDVTLTLAPVLCIGGVTFAAVRLVPLLLRLSSGWALRARGLVLGLAVQQAARRPHPGTAMVLIATSVAAATFGLGFRATWQQSQTDQADLLVGADASLTLPETPSATGAGSAVSEEDSRAVLAAAGRSPISAVVDRPLVIGRYAGTPGTPPVLVAIDSRAAGSLLRGRTAPGTSFADVGSELDPGAAIAGLPLDDGATLSGTTTGAPFTVTATVVVQGASGLRRPIVSEPLPLDGQDRALVWSEDLEAGLRVLAMSLHVDRAPSPVLDDELFTQMAVTVTLPGSGGGEGGEWQTSPDPDSPIDSPGVTLERLPDGGSRLEVVGVGDLFRLSQSGGDLLVTGFAPPDAVPVAVSEDLADAVGVKVGGELAGTVAGTDLTLRVAAVVPVVPSAPGRTAVLADLETVSRALLAAGQVEPALDGWWVADPSPQTLRTLQDLGLGEVVTRGQVATDLARAPLQVTVPSVMNALVVAAVLLFLSGVALVTGADQRRRSAELARLRALGLPRRGARRLLLAEHVAFLAPLVVLGALVGVAASVVLAPLMVRSDLGAAPVPPAVAVLPWTGGLLVLLAALALGSTLVTWLVTRRQVRGSDTAGLRMGDA